MELVGCICARLLYTDVEMVELYFAFQGLGAKARSDSYFYA
jgi:hypothetical protein